MSVKLGTVRVYIKNSQYRKEYTLYIYHIRETIVKSVKNKPPYNPNLSYLKLIKNSA